MMKNLARQYLELVTGDYQGLNLTRILDFDDFFNKQILDSIVPSEQCEKFDKLISGEEYVIDVGFGGGFPIIPLAKKYYPKIFFGVDARAKKVKAVSEICARIGLDNVYVKHMRLEDIYFDKQFVLLFKAVGKISDMLDIISSDSSGHACFYKGPSLEQEEPNYLKFQDWDLIIDQKFLISGLVERRLIVYKRKKVLRGTFKNKTKLSDLFCRPFENK